MDGPCLSAQIPVLVSQVAADDHHPRGGRHVEVVQEPPACQEHLEGLGKVQTGGYHRHWERPVEVLGFLERKCHDVGHLECACHRFNIGKPGDPRGRILGDTRVTAKATQRALCVRNNQVSSQVREDCLEVTLRTLVDPDRRHDGSHTKNWSEHY